MIDPGATLPTIEAFLADTGMTPTAFGRDALGDPGFVFALRNGRDCRVSTLARARAQIELYRETGQFLPRPVNSPAEPSQEAAA